ncbi:hypothetical protein NFF66_13035 [Proteus mirabilis]|uniref:phage tail fiber protein n=1 Tax=Proteus mirabilis TaxID=584 RepID=UPI0023F984E8|nr:hypothetical protein [Proteus mirabilis]MDF7255731.1 hypothetical protein [Proteus mirabilis]MDF7349913.1 hypothetical protein [Proteus mirabilis]
MIYTTGTVSTVSGSAIVSGTGTKWTVNNPAIRSGTIILIKNGNANFIYMVDRVNSDTELVISQPATFTVKNTSYSINLTEPNSYSDANNRMTAIASDTTYFLRAMDQWMMNNGVVTVELSNGQKVTLDSIKKMQGDIGKKLSPGDFGIGRSNETGDKHTQDANSIKYTGFATPNGANAVNYYNSYYPLLSMTRDGANGEGNNSQIQATPEGLAYRWMGNGNISDWQELANKSSSSTQLFKSSVEATTKITSKSADGRTSISLSASNSGGTNIELNSASGYNGIQIPKKSGALMLVGDYGIGNREPTLADTLEPTKIIDKTQLIRSYGGDNLRWGVGMLGFYSGATHWGAFTFNDFTFNVHWDMNGTVSQYYAWTSKNTTTDPQGFIKKASPIIDINPDGTFTTNDESEGATVTRVAQGEYLIEGVLGFNADAGWGGVDSGIEIPLDVNKQPLIWVNSIINKDGSILVKTYHRTHPDAPSFANNEIEGVKNGDLIDIPDGRFISVRVQMPDQSIYNVRMREIEEAQKAEEERRQEEEENQDTNSAPEIDN